MKINYRPEIDGLRCLAVISVIIYHAKISINDYRILKGGFLGVDIFFVISGYLITTIILKELILGSFSLSSFYERRARRILPCLIFVMIVTLFFGFFFLIPSSLIDTSYSILSSIFFVSNFYFYYADNTYEAIDSLLKPFLHSWSLSVEEQFYLIFPIFFLIYNFNKKYFLGILFSVLLLSLSLAQIGSKYFHSFNFYILPSRAWEFISGAILAYYHLFFVKKKTSKKHIHYLSIFAIFFIFIPLFFFDDTMNLPSFYSLIVVIGTLIIINDRKNISLTNKIFSLKLFTKIGLISYSLYLWHFPIFAFARSIFDSSDNNLIIIKIFIIFLLLSLSLLSFFFVESFFRNPKVVSKSIFIKLLLTSCFLLIVINILVIRGNIYNKHWFAYKNYNFDNGFYRNERDKFSKELKALGLEDFNLNDNSKKILIIGNSHGVDTFISFYLNKKLYPGYQFSLLQTELKCLHFNFYSDNDCKSFLMKKNDLIKADTVILSSRIYNNDLIYLDEIIKNLIYLNKKVIVTTSAPEYNITYRYGDIFTISDNYLFNKKVSHISKDEKTEIEKIYYNQRNKDKNRDVDFINEKIKIISLNNKIQIIDKNYVQCEEIKNRCFFISENGEKLIHDYGHYTLAGAKFFGKRIFDLNLIN